MGPFCYLCFMFVLFVLCSFVITCWERAYLLRVEFSGVFVTFPYGVRGQVWYLIVLILDLCLPIYFAKKTPLIFL